MAQPSPAPETSAVPPALEGNRILIKPRPGASRAAVADFHARQKVELLRTFNAIGNIQLLRVPEGENIRAFVEKYQRSGLVDFAEPDYRARLACVTPNDPHYVAGLLWGLDNAGQLGGAPDADIDAPEAWDILTSASNVVVAVIDTGVRYTHEDLADNAWVNPLDGSHGLNALGGSNDPNDDSGHGTLIAGVIGALGNNSTGVVGVVWRVQIMACKFADNSGGYFSDAVACLDYARTNGASVVNLSWGGYDLSLSLSNALHEVRQAGLVVIAAAGNDAIDIDARPYYPASFDFDNIVAVAATTRRDELYALSNIGARTVDLAAPGQDIYSTAFQSDTAYGSDQGTSMAAAYVSGACALLRARYPTETAQQIIQRLLAGTDPLPALAGLCVTGGRLNLRKALGPPDAAPARLLALAPTSDGSFQLRLSGEPQRAYIIQATTNLINWTPLFTNVTALSGTFVFTDNSTTSWTQRFFRAESAP
jgi:subtilisin family serine protease